MRPLRQITGEAEFNEIFLSGVEVPARERDRRDRRRLGRRDDDAPPRARDARVRARRAARGAGAEARSRSPRDRGATPVQREAIAREWIHLQALRITAYRSLSALERTGIPGPEGSILKLQWSEANQRVTKLALELLGPDAQLLAPNAPVRRLLDGPAAPQPRQHDRGRHVGDPPQHRRRAGARPAEVEVAWTSSFTPLQDELRAQARGVPRGDARADAGRSSPSSAGPAPRSPRSTAAPGSTFLEEAVLHEEAGRALLHAPLWSTSSLLPFLPADDQAAVAAGETSWTLALGPLVPDLDTATNVAVVGGDTIWELDGAEREVLATSDETRPLGVVSGGEAGRALCSSDVLPALRARSLAILALEAVGVGTRALELSLALRRASASSSAAGSAPTRPSRTRSRARTRSSSSRARSRGGRRGASRTTIPRPPSPPRPRRPTPPTPPSLACERAIQAHGGIGFTWEHVLHRLYKRALWIQSWEASPAQLRAEVASHLLDGGGA